MNPELALFLSRCTAVVADHGTVLASLFVTGLVGGLSHCAGMCGPFVLSQVTSRLEALPVSAMSEWHRLAGAALVPYHLGRAVTYAGLGALAALAISSFGEFSGLKYVSGALLLLAALVLLGHAVPRLKTMLNVGGGSAGQGRWGNFVGRVAGPLFARPVGFRGFLLGVALGFIPCGLLYAALAAAAASGDPLAGAFAMLAFVAGTIPSLVVVGLVGHMATRRWRDPVMRWAPLLLILNAGVLTFFAWQMIA